MAKESKPNVEALLTAIRNRKFEPVYFFCGEEPYYIDLLTNALEQHVLSEMEKAFNMTILYGKETSVRQVTEACGRLPMMAERQLVIVREAQALEMRAEADEKMLLNYLKKPVPSTVLVFAWKNGKPDGRKSFGKELQKSAVYYESAIIKDEGAIATWIKKWLSEREFKITDNAASLLVEFTGNELSKVSNELEKLILNKAPKTTINEQDIESGVGISKEYSVFELTNAILQHDVTKANRIVNYFAANPKSGPIQQILPLLYGNFTKVYRCHFLRGLNDNDTAAALGIVFFAAREYKQATRHYSLSKLEQIFGILEEYDLRSKGIYNYNTGPDGLLRELIFRIMH